MTMQSFFQWSFEKRFDVYPARHLQESFPLKDNVSCLQYHRFQLVLQCLSLEQHFVVLKQNELIW